MQGLFCIIFNQYTIKEPLVIIFYPYLFIAYGKTTLNFIYFTNISYNFDQIISNSNSYMTIQCILAIIIY